MTRYKATNHTQPLITSELLGVQSPNTRYALSFICVLMKNKNNQSPPLLQSVTLPTPEVLHHVGVCWCIGEENTSKPLPCGSILCQCRTNIQWPTSFIFLPSSRQSHKELDNVLNVNFTGNKILSLQGTDAAQVQSNSPLNLTASQHTFPPLTVVIPFRWLEDLRSPTEVKQKQRKEPSTTHCPECGPPQKGALYSPRSRPRTGTSSSPAANCSATAPRS